MSKVSKQLGRQRRAVRTRTHLKGEHPRVSVFRSNKHIYAQIIDQTSGRSLLGASDLNLNAEEKKAPGAKRALAVGKLLAKKAAEKKITKVVFDKGSYKYHGLVKAVAEGARETGLKF